MRAISADETPPEDAAPTPPEVALRAHRLLIAALIFYLLAVAVASPWDIYWHTQIGFDSFWAPPHVFLYLCVLMGTATVGGIAANPSLRAAFGPSLKGLPKPFQLPGSLLILGAGFAMLTAGGGIDWFWHSTWGQNETRWSFPHGVLAFGVYLVALGIASGRLALAPSRPFGRGTAVFYGLLTLGFSMSSLLGPMAFNISPDVNGVVAQMPGFWGPDATEVMGIIARWHLERTNLFFPAMAAIWAVVGISVMRVFDARPRSVLATCAVASAVLAVAGLGWAWRTNLIGTPSAWLPLAVLPGALAWVLVERRPPLGRFAPAIVGLAVALLTCAVYNPTPAAVGLALLGAPAGWVAGILGGAMAAQLKQATTRGIVVMLSVICIIAPALLGVLDLYFRFTPA